jgi:hypothetical protein
VEAKSWSGLSSFGQAARCRWIRQAACRYGPLAAPEGAPKAVGIKYATPPNRELEKDVNEVMNVIKNQYL